MLSLGIEIGQTVDDWLTVAQLDTEPPSASKLGGNAYVTNSSKVTDSAAVFDNAIVGGHAEPGGGSPPESQKTHPEMTSHPRSETPGLTSSSTTKVA